MNKIECGFCHKVILFKDEDVKSSGKAKLLRCPHCTRSVTTSFNEIKYYEEINNIEK